MAKKIILNEMLDDEITIDRRGKFVVVWKKDQMIPIKKTQVELFITKLREVAEGKRNG